jgi:hypothetical protein
MNVSTAMPATVEIRRLLGLIGGVAALAAAVTWAALAFGVGSGTRVVSEQQAVLAKLSPSSRQYVEAVSTMTPVELKATFGTGDVDAIDALRLSPQSETYVRAVASMTPAELRATFGTGGVDTVDATAGSAAIPASGYLEALNSTFGSAAIPASGYLDAVNATLGSVAIPASGYVEAITKMTPAELRATFGTGPVDTIDTLGLNPKSEQYVRAVASMSPEELTTTFGTGH